MKADIFSLLFLCYIKSMSVNLRKRQDKHFCKNDFILFLIFLAVAGLLLWVMESYKKDGSKVEILIDNELYAAYSLEENREVKIPVGEHYNTLQIMDGSVQMLEADCPEQLCVMQKPIRKCGETIICLPHKLIIQISGGRQ